jgi:alpha-D-ribose 1-methylphosphonate 5-triphosphate synthase subunit PhnG
MGNNITKERQHWMTILAKADPVRLEHMVGRLDVSIDYRFVRAPETGMVMVRARAGGSGQQFNFGETTVTRCTLATDEGYSGHAYVMGRSHRHAELAALMDAFLNNPDTHDIVMDCVIHPLEMERKAQKKQQASETAATKVDFFTMVRGQT